MAEEDCILTEGLHYFNGRQESRAGVLFGTGLFLYIKSSSLTFQMPLQCPSCAGPGHPKMTSPGLESKIGAKEMLVM